MKKSWSVVGEWWLPEDEARRCFGRFSWTPESGGELEVYGDLIPQATSFEFPGSNTPRIYGLTSDRQSISLWDCFGSGGNYSGLLCIRQNFSVLRVVVGLHCSEAELKFTRASMEYEHLGTWLRGFSGIQVLLGLGIGYRFSFVPELVLGHRDDIIVTLFVQGRTSGSAPAHRVEMTEEIILNLHKQEPVLLEEALCVEHDLRSFLAFSTGLPIRCNQLELTGGRIPRGIEVHYLWLQAGSRGPEPDVTFLPYKAILHPVSGEQLAILLQCWLGMPDEMRQMLQRLTAISYLPWLYLEHEFLTVAFCLEEFHNQLHSGDELPVEEHAARMAAILEAAPTEHRSWLGEKLRYSNELSFRRKLRRLLEALPGDSPALAILGNLSDFVHDVVSTRNFHVHHDPTLRSAALSGENLRRLTDKLTMVLELLALTQLRAPGAMLDELVKRRWKFLLP